MGLMAELKLISISKNNQEIVEIQNAKLPTPTSISQTPIPYSARDNTVPPVDMVQDNNDPWGVAKQIDEHTCTMIIGMDERMATPQEVFDALNAYRQRNGVGALTWSESLAKYAQTRCNDFTALGGIDGHKGFNDYLNNPDNY